ncbi:MAG: nucleoside hydrolase [Bryobacteraceae bacterium]
MQFGSQGKPPVGVIVDTDMGNSIDDVLALALLYGLEGKDETRLISVSVSKSSLDAAALCEVIGQFYAGSVNAGFASIRRTLPVGLSVEGRMPETTPMMKAVLERKNDDGSLAYKHGIANLNDTAEVPALLRNALTAQHDQNAVVVLLGPATNLARLLEVHGARELIAKKVRFLSLMGGAYPTGEPEFNIKADIAAARKVFAEWPTPIVASGFEVGNAIPYPGSAIETGFGWATAPHPVVDAYRGYQAMPYDTPSWDLTAALHAVRPEGGFFQFSEPGTITVENDGRTRFRASADGKHRYLIVDPAQTERIVKTYVQLTTAKPVVKQRRFRRPPVEDPAKPPAKPADAPKTESVKPAATNPREVQ